MTTPNKEILKQDDVPELAPKRKSPVYKLSPDQLTQQVIALETKEMLSVKAAITAEETRRKEELNKKLQELEGEGK